MKTTMIADIEKEIVYDRATRDFAIYISIDGARELIGFARTHHEAEVAANQYVYDFLMDSNTIEAAAELLLAA